MILDATSPPVGTVRDWLDARAKAGGIAFIFPETGESLYWAEVRNIAARLAGSLTDLGVAKSESVAIMHPNGRDGVLALFAVLYGGFRATMINLVSGPDAVGFALRHSEAALAFIHADHRELFDYVRPHSMQVVEISEAKPEGTLHDLSASDHALLMYTSGTTGKPKGVVTLMPACWPEDGQPQLPMP